MIVAHIITRFIRGGADENTLLCCNAQAERNMTVHLIVGNEINQDMIARLHPSVSLHIVPQMVRDIEPLNDFTALVGLCRLLSALKPDIVHTHTSKAGILGRVAAIFARHPKIIHGVHILPFLNVGRMKFWLYLGLERMLVRWTHMYVNVSTGMQVEGIKHRVGCSAQHVVIPSGMDVEKFRRASGYPHAELLRMIGGDFILEGMKVIVMVAALEPRKRIYEFLSVFSALVERHPNAIFVVLGEGHDAPRISARAEQLGLSSRVFLAGFHSDVEKWIASADVCVLASEREGLPRAVVQYALCACPCVVTNLPGVDAVVKHGDTGFLVEPNQLDKMHDYLDAILSDPEKADDMRANAKMLDLSAWGVEHMVSELEGVYRQVLTRPSI